jgi:hypothetical protein
MSNYTLQGIAINIEDMNEWEVNRTLKSKGFTRRKFQTKELDDVGRNELATQGWVNTP